MSLIYRNPIRLTLLSAVALVGISAQANAAAYFLQEQSVSGLGTAYSGGAANMHDASTVFYNPAGMTTLSGTHAQFGAINISPNTSLTNKGTTINGAAANGGDGGNPYDTFNPVPHAYISHQLSDQVWIGFAATIPFGLSEEYDQGWFGRWNSTKTQLKVIDLAPSIAFKINNQWSLGAGLDFQYAIATLEANPMLNNGTGIVSRLHGHDWDTGANVGVQFHPDMNTNLGLTYRSQVNHTLKGSISTDGAVVSNTPGQANLDLPDIVTFGASHKLNNQWTVQGQVNWFNWSRFNNITAVRNTGILASKTIEGYDDSWGFAAGAEYQYNDKWAFRGGMQFDQTPTSSNRDTRVPDGDRTWLTGGLTYNFTPNTALNFGAAYIWVSEENINVTSAATGLGSSNIVAGSDGHVILTGLDMTYKF